MSKRKGLSLEEKRTRMLDIFYEKKDVFQLKDLEKIAPAEKQIISQSVKDVVKSLVDDGYVDSEKIGLSIYFWAFPSKATQVRKRRLEDLDKHLEDIKRKKNEIEESIKQEKAARVETSERAALLSKYKELQKSISELEKVYEVYKDADPVVIAQEKKDLEKAKEATNRWTDNLYTLRSWMCSKTGLSNKEFDDFTGADMEYIGESGSQSTEME